MKSKYEDGVYTHLSNFDYHHDNRLSRSGILKLMDNPAKFKYHYIDNNEEASETKNLTLGSAIHTACLEPHLLYERYAFYPEGIDARHKAGKEIKEANKDKKMLTFDDQKMLLDIQQSIFNNKIYQDHIQNNNNGMIECSLLYTSKVENIKLKSRPDFFNDNVVIDLKSCASIKQRDFENSMAIYGYHIQAAMIQDALEQLTGKLYNDFIFLLVEKEPPYICKSYYLSPKAIEIGRQQYISTLHYYNYLIKTNLWDEENNLMSIATLPSWYLMKHSNKLDNQPIEEGDLWK